jgi:hypothetical protein
MIHEFTSQMLEQPSSQGMQRFQRNHRMLFGCSPFSLNNLRIANQLKRNIDFVKVRLGGAFTKSVWDFIEFRVLNTLVNYPG